MMFFRAFVILFLFISVFNRTEARSPKRAVQNTISRLDPCNGSPYIPNNAEVLLTATTAHDVISNKHCRRVTLTNIPDTYSDSATRLDYLILNFRALRAEPLKISSTSGLSLEVTRVMGNSTRSRKVFTLTRPWSMLKSPMNNDFLVFSNYNGDTFRTAVFEENGGVHTETIELKLKQGTNTIYERSLRVDEH